MATLIRDYDIEQVDPRNEWVFKSQFTAIPSGWPCKIQRRSREWSRKKERKGNHRRRKPSHSILMPVIGFSTITVGITCRRNPTGIDIAPRMIEYAHWSPVNFVIENARPPTNIIRIWAPIMMQVIAIKSQLWWIPSMRLNDRSICRLLYWG